MTFNLDQLTTEAKPFLGGYLTVSPRDVISNGSSVWLYKYAVLFSYGIDIEPVEYYLIVFNHYDLDEELTRSPSHLASYVLNTHDHHVEHRLISSWKRSYEKIII